MVQLISKCKLGVLKSKCQYILREYLKFSEKENFQQCAISLFSVTVNFHSYSFFNPPFSITRAPQKTQDQPIATSHSQTKASTIIYIQILKKSHLSFVGPLSYTGNTRTYRIRAVTDNYNMLYYQQPPGEDSPDLLPVSAHTVGREKG